MPSRPRQSRSKTGCFCCRLRRKKCPEEKPICRSCKKLGLQCVWPQTTEFAWRLNLGIESDTPSREAIESLSGSLKQREGKKSRQPSALVSFPSPTSISPSSSSSGPSSDSSQLQADSGGISAGTCDTADVTAPPESPDIEEIWPELFAFPTPGMDFDISDFDMGQINWVSPPGLAPGSASSSLDAISQSALQFYIQHTSEIMMSRKPGAENLWQSTVLQLAEADELVMSGVLALGSIHMSANVPDRHTIDEATTKYVLRAVTGLQKSLRDWNENGHKSSDDTLRLMLITLLLAEHECLAGNDSGSVQLHLRASYPVAKALESRRRSEETELATHLLENTAYLQFLSCLRFPQPGSRDSCDLLRMIQEGRLTLLKSQDTFGSHFGCAVDLYEMIPALHKFYATRELELATDRDLGCATEFTSLLHIISSWQPEPDPAEVPGYSHTNLWWSDQGGYMGRGARDSLKDAEGNLDDRKANRQAMIASALVIQNVLVLFLYSAYLRHSEDLDRLNKAAQPIVEDSLDQLDRVSGTTWANTSWWITVVVGSFARTKDQRRRLERNIRACEPPLLLTIRGLDLLKSVWDAPDDDFGFDGLSRRIGPNGAFCFG